MEALLARVRAGQAVEFSEVLALIEQRYHYRPSAFSNGSGTERVNNRADENQGACRVLAFAQLHQLNAEQTLALFGHHYRDVLADPAGQSHANIRAFMRSGWQGVSFEQPPLLPR